VTICFDPHTKLIGIATTTRY